MDGLRLGVGAIITRSSTQRGLANVYAVCHQSIVLAMGFVRRTSILEIAHGPFRLVLGFRLLQWLYDSEGEIVSMLAGI